MSFELPPCLLGVTALKLTACLSFNIVMLQCRGCFYGSDFNLNSGVKEASSSSSHLERGDSMFQAEDAPMATSAEHSCPVCVVDASLVFNCAVCGL